MQSRYCVGVIAARQTKNLFTVEQLDAEVEKLIRPFMSRGNLSVISSGCDNGLPQALKAFCVAGKVNFLEIRVVLEGMLERPDLNQVWLARNGAILELAQQVIVVTTPDRRSTIAENAVDRARRMRLPFSVYVPLNGALVEMEYER